MKPTAFIFTAIVTMAVVTLLTSPEPRSVHREYWDQAIFLDSIRTDTMYGTWVLQKCNGDTLVPFLTATPSDTVYLTTPFVYMSDSAIVSR